jgi:anaerobic ribonucleoside-triphosphate reductase activating protein
MMIRLSSKIQKDSIVDGEGIRTVIWTQGCPHNCVGCHNKETHSFSEGHLVDVEDVKNQLDELECQDGITLSGGDPLCQIDAVLAIAQYAKSKNLNIWCYTGYTYDQILKMGQSNNNYLQFLNNIDVLIDGKFDIAKKSLNLKFKGSSNQRIIDVPKSILRNRVCLVKKYNSVKKYKPLYEKCEYIFT